MARPEPDCIWRMKKIQTPRMRIIGSQDSRIEKIEPDPSFSGRALIVTPLSSSRWTSVELPGE